MIDYVAPLKDMRFVLGELVDINALSKLPGLENGAPDLAETVLEEAGKFATAVLSPLNAASDRQGAQRDADTVVTPSGFKEAYGKFVDAGWNALSCAPEYGGQGMPRVLSAFVEEMWRGANMSFGGCAALTRGAIEPIERYGSDELKRGYLPRLIRGEWTGTMNLTEPQAGSDLSAIKTRAEAQGNGTYRIVGQKIFISWGDHDLAENIAHLVLARTVDAPAGVRGLSMFLVPKYLVNSDGSIGARNDVRCVSLERKVGQHASPNAVMAFGANEAPGSNPRGAIGYLVGEENRGIEYMFVMMNEARFSVGLEGIGLSERAYQSAVAFARERVQGTEAGSRSDAKVRIIRHPDVRRMLMWMKSHTEAGRALAGVVAAEMDVARCHPSSQERSRASAFVNLMTPIIKGWCTENAVEVTSLCIQIHGGMGYMEETGVAQYWRDARITPIYEGTTAIQANDLVGRKIARDGAVTIRQLVRDMLIVQGDLERQESEALSAIGRGLGKGIANLRRAIDFIVATHELDVRRVLAGAVPFLKLFGTVAGGWQLGRSALLASAQLSKGSADASFYRAKIQTARFFSEHVISQTTGFADTLLFGADSILELDEDTI